MNVNLQAGTGTVIFARANDAVKAKKKYDRVTLDNRPMSIEVRAGNRWNEETVSEDGKADEENCRFGR